MGDKEFKTLDEQIELLTSRGLSIPDTKKAKSFLLRNNYYRVSGYSLTLRSHDVFYEGTDFDNIIDIYSFDHELRHLLLQYIEIIEVTVKSIYAYEFTKRHGATGYRNKELFTDSEMYDSLSNKIEKQKEKQLPHEAYLKHFIEDLKQDVPLWAYVDLMTISDISLYYKISQQDVKDAVASDLGISNRGKSTLGSDLLERFMHGMTIIRNLCAHGSRLYNRLFEQMPWLSSKERSLLAKNPDGTVDNSHLFGFILLMKRLLQNIDFSELKDGIKKISEKYPFVIVRYYGFPENWYDII